MTVQVGLRRTWSETTLLVFPQGGSYDSKKAIKSRDTSGHFMHVKLMKKVMHIKVSFPHHLIYMDDLKKKKKKKKKMVAFLGLLLESYWILTALVAEYLFELAR